MGIADAVKLRSPDPKTQVGAVLVDENSRVIGTGYNGPPAGFKDEVLDWKTRDDSLYQRIVHAEMNAILYSGARYDERAKLYVTMSPCKDCLKLVAAAGIKTIHYRERYKDFVTVEQLAAEFGIQLIQHEVKSNV
jgi:dCMP deaminase